MVTAKPDTPTTEHTTHAMIQHARDVVDSRLYPRADAVHQRFILPSFFRRSLSAFPHHHSRLS